jgi:uncharacterized membrane protein YphA (DoxX/SURF4 family)
MRVTTTAIFAFFVAIIFFSMAFNALRTGTVGRTTVTSFLGMSTPKDYEARRDTYPGTYWLIVCLELGGCLLLLLGAVASMMGP